MTEPWSLEESYDAYPRIEEAFEQALDEGLAPRGPSLLFDLVAGLGFPSGAVAVDIGCGEGGHALRLAERFAFDVTGVDPVERHVASSNAALADRPDLAHRVRFRSGTAEAIPVPDDCVDLVWCVDVLSHVEDVDVAAAEVRRVLRPDGRALVFASMGTDRLEPVEGAWLWRVMGVVPTSADPALVEAGFAAGGSASRSGTSSGRSGARRSRSGRARRVASSCTPPASSGTPSATWPASARRPTR